MSLLFLPRVHEMGFPRPQLLLLTTKNGFQRRLKSKGRPSWLKHWVDFFALLVLLLLLIHWKKKEVRKMADPTGRKSPEWSTTKKRSRGRGGLFAPHFLPLLDSNLSAVGYMADRPSLGWAREPSSVRRIEQTSLELFCPKFDRRNKEPAGCTANSLFSAVRKTPQNERLEGLKIRTRKAR